MGERGAFDFLLLEDGAGVCVDVPAILPLRFFVPPPGVKPAQSKGVHSTVTSRGSLSYFHNPPSLARATACSREGSKQDVAFASCRQDVGLCLAEQSGEAEEKAP